MQSGKFGPVLQLEHLLKGSLVLIGVLILRGRQGLGVLLIEVLGSTSSFEVVFSSDLLPAFFFIEREALLLVVLEGDVVGVCFSEDVKEGVDEFVVGLYVFREEVEVVHEVVADAAEQFI